MAELVSEDAGRANVARAVLQANQIEADSLLAELTATVQREQTASSEKVALQQLTQNDEQFKTTIAQNERFQQVDATLKKQGLDLNWAIASLTKRRCHQGKSCAHCATGKPDRGGCIAR